MKEANICNDALAKLGQAMISQKRYDLAKSGDQSVDPVTRACAALYDTARRESLCAVRWSFAVRFVKLCVVPEGACDLPSGFLAAYGLPTACLRVLDVPLKHWMLMGRRIISPGKDEELEISYINDERNVDLFDPLFSDAFATLLASKLSGPVTGDSRARDALLSQYERVILPKAAYVNRVQDQSNDQHPLRNILNRGLRR